jgi:hypothetical protein
MQAGCSSDARASGSTGAGSKGSRDIA